MLRTYDGSVGLHVNAAQALELHHGLRLLLLLTTSLQVSIEEVHHLQQKRNEAGVQEINRQAGGRAVRQVGRKVGRKAGRQASTCLRHQARPLVILWIAMCRLFISPSSSGAERLSELKLLRRRARKRFNSWR